MSKSHAILLTGFKPFSPYPTNISGKLAKAMDDIEIMGYHIEGKEIPLRFQEIRPLIEQYLNRYDPCIAICTGIAPAFFISLETVAQNWVDIGQSSYNCGTIVSGRRLDRDAPSRLPSMLPIKFIFKRLKEKDFPVRISNDAGKFGCNQIFFYMMVYLENNHISIPAGFIHVPAASLSLDELISAFEEILQEIISHTTGLK